MHLGLGLGVTSRGTGSGAGGAPPVVYTWNPLDKHADMALSNGDLTATCIDGEGAGDVAVRGTIGKSTGKWHVEFTIGAGEWDNNNSVGFVPGTWALDTSDSYLGGANTIGTYSTALYVNDAYSVMDAYAVGDVVAYEINFDDNLVRVAVNDGGWSADASISAVTGTPLFPALACVAVGDGATINMGASAFAKTVSEGFTAWDGGEEVGPAAQVFTWNPDDKHADNTLSNGNLTATKTAADSPSGYSNVRATNGKSTGKWHFEIVPVVNIPTPGLANAVAGLETYPGEDNNSVGVFPGDAIYIGGSSVKAVTFAYPSIAFAVEVNLDAALFWAASDDSDWNDDASADPATGVGGVDISAITGALFPLGSNFNLNDAVTLNVGGSALTRAVSEGFTAWDGGDETGPLYSAEALAFFSRVSDPGTTRKGHYNTLINSLVSAGVWAKLDAFYVFAAADDATALTNLVSASYGATAVNSPIFTADLGFTGASAKSIDSNFNPTTATSPKYVIDDACAFGFTTKVGTDVGSLVGTALLHTVEITPRWSDDHIYTQLNDADEGDFGTNSDGSGFWSVNRDNSANYKLYRNGSVVGSPIATGGSNNLPNSNILFLRYYGAYHAGPVLAGGFGSNLDATQQAALYNAVHVYLQAVAGVP